ncbi:alpha/beta fold hydrolase [Paraglaciecola marina]|uniref:alpha/beta fold hydrolase n=1 Tax=Paraglaciecola marina TaxID=2500157 RepID=UPI001EF0A3AB|nr:alpha/beta hydrolase [Paraglaciecola marina]
MLDIINVTALPWLRLHKLFKGAYILVSNPTISIHFSHANGFPVGSYRRLFDGLADDIEVFGLPKFAHSESFPVNANFANLNLELVHHLESHVCKPVYLVGHSMGAVVSFMVACERPDLVKGLIMLDPPIASGMASLLFKAMKLFGQTDRFTPAGKSKNRCKSWPLGTDLVAYFQAKALFKNFEKECVQDYVASAITEKEGHLQLNYDVNIETEIYRNVPDNIHKYYKRLKVPTLLISGEKSELNSTFFLSSFLKNTGAEQQVLRKGGHMFPLEQPLKVANIINEKLLQWEQEYKTKSR